MVTSRGLRIQYGGTFDPVHNGHLAVARSARDRLHAQVYLMPAADPPHKGPTAASARQRLSMLQAAVGDTLGLGVDARELRRAGPSYTVDTLRELRDELGADAPLAILIGADSFLALPTWKSWQSLFDFAHIVVAERPGSDFDPQHLPAPLAEASAGRWRVPASALHARPAGLLLRLRLPLRPESSSELRARIAAGQAWRAWVPAGVADYIVRHGLYGAHAAE